MSLTHRGRDKMAAIFAYDIFKCIFLNEIFWITNKISLKYVLYGLIENKPSLVQIMGSRRRERSWLTHICATRSHFARYVIFSCDQAALRMAISVCLSVCLSVRLPVCLWHLFDNVPIIVSSLNFQKLLPMTKVMSMQKVKVKGQGIRGQNPT